MPTKPKSKFEALISEVVDSPSGTKWLADLNGRKSGLLTKAETLGKTRVPSACRPEDLDFIAILKYPFTVGFKLTVHCASGVRGQIEVL
ncbi:MAG: hypothetical protein NZ840_11755 [Anaerolineales bacterium]|nr:hypothetical protein [Anaerolineales bacterium]MDW8162709.1 hypothetical protein [Anaerolineales bacterium]